MTAVTSARAQDVFPEAIAGLLGGGVDQDASALACFLSAVAHGKADPRETIGALAAFSARPASAPAIVALVRAVEADAPARCGELDGCGAVNIVGSGGGAPSFNISTTAALIAAASGVKVLKSGSAAYSSASGAVDLLRQAGIALSRSPDQAARRLERHGVAFYSPGDFSLLLKRLAMAAAPRPLKTYAPILNRIGPLLRPLPVAGQLTGIASAGDASWYAGAFRLLGRCDVSLVASEAGLDEACSFTRNRLWRVGEAGAAAEEEIDPVALGLAPGGLADVAGGSPAQNLGILEAILAGEGTVQARESALLNAALLIRLAGAEERLEDALMRAREAIASGAAAGLLRDLRAGDEAGRAAS